MMRGFNIYCGCVVAFSAVAVTSITEAQETKEADVGQESIGKLRVSLIYGTNGVVHEACKGLPTPDKNQLAALAELSKIKFEHYRVLGNDSQPILRSYENWARPLKGSEEVLVSFQPRGEASQGSLTLDIEFWQSQKKVLKGGISLNSGKPLYIQGPEWRGGKVIAMVELLSLTASK